MIRHVLKISGQLFTETRSRVRVALLILLFASIPITEMLAVRLFSGIITGGRALYAENPSRVIWQIVIFFLALGTTRAAHHGVKFLRVRVFRTGFAAGDTRAAPDKESWQWALAFEMSNVLSATVQILMFSALFFFFDLVTGVANLFVALCAFAAISLIYKRQLTLQREYLETRWSAAATAIPDRVSTRIRDSEIGAVIGTIGLLLALIVVLARTLSGHVQTSDAIVLFLGLRLMYGQLGSLSSSAMRFARAAVHL